MSARLPWMAGMTILVTLTIDDPLMPHHPTWSVAEAKARFSEVLDKARGAPQTITRNGKRVAVIVSAEEWERRTVRAGTLAGFLAASPLRGAKLRLDRAKDRPRDIDL